MITIENCGKDIKLYGRDQNGEAYIQNKSFTPYFYYEDRYGNYTTLDGKKASKQVCRLPSDVPILRQKYNKTYEADIRYVNRYIIDEIDKIEKQPIRICYIDIEILKHNNMYGTAEQAVNPIVAICCYDSFTKTYRQFVAKLETEKEMLNKFIKYIKETDPDMLIAWNGDGFDFPFLINRMRRLKINPNLLSRENSPAYTSKYDAKIYGRVLFDLMRAYKKMISGQGRESWSLDYISRYELGSEGGKEEYKGELDDLYRSDLDKFVSYNTRDVELLVLLNEKLKVIDFFDELRRLCYCRFEDIFMNTKLADCLCLKHAKGKYILPSVAEKKQRKPFTGGFVHKSEPRLHKNIAVMDMKSLYPSIMVSFNTSWETFLPSKEDGCINIDDKYFYKKEIGIIPAIVKPLLQERGEVKKKKEEAKIKYGKDSREFKTYHMTQFALKVIANSFYGVLACPHFRLYKNEVAQSITYTAQKIVKEVMRWFEEKGYKIVYGDTDSVFIYGDGLTIEMMTKLNSDINNYFKDYFTQFGVEKENNIFELQFDKVFKTVFFKRKNDGTGAKKRYAGRVIWEDGKDVDFLGIVGFESRRSDSPQIGRELLKKVLEMITYEKPKEDIDRLISDFKEKIINGGFTPEQMGLPIGISKPLEKYGNQIHARAARKANDLHNAQIGMGDKIKYIYVDEDVIAFKDYLWDGYKINSDKMIRRIVDLKVGPIYESMGWEYEYLEMPNKRKEKDVKFEQKFKQKELWK